MLLEVIEMLRSAGYSERFAESLRRRRYLRQKGCCSLEEIRELAKLAKETNPELRRRVTEGILNS